MTRFVGDSLATRTGRGSNKLTSKDFTKSMKVFQETGKHPIIERTRQENAASALVPLPTLDINRPHVFLDLHHHGKDMGRIIIELFEDLLPATCSTFRHRCLEGHNTVKGTNVHKLQRSFAAFGGQLSPAAAMPTNSGSKNQLQHTDSGLLSVHQDGTHFALTLGRALALDNTYVVIGRVGKGIDVLSSLNDIPTDICDAPDEKITISQCGTSDHRGLNESLSAGVSGATVSVGDAAAAAKGAMAEAAAGVKDALAQGLKRKAPEADRLKRLGKHSKRNFLSEELSDENDSDSEEVDALSKVGEAS